MNCRALVRRGLASDFYRRLLLSPEGRGTRAIMVAEKTAETALAVEADGLCDRFNRQPGGLEQAVREGETYVQSIFS